MNLNKPRLQQRVKRARSVVGIRIQYKLGKGGWNPRDDSPGEPIPGKYDACDCSGFVAWVLGMRRDQINAKKPWSKLLPWIETTMVYRDATKTNRVFVQIPQPVPGCLVVYGDRGRSEGHIGVVTEVRFANDKPLHGIRDIKVVDCSSGMSRRTGDAIHERDGEFFLRSGAIFCVLREDLL